MLGYRKCPLEPDVTATGRSPPQHQLALEEARLVACHGDLMDGHALTALFKFSSPRSFRRSAAKGSLPVSVFRLPGRRGWFARTRDVAVWLAAVGASSELRTAAQVAEPTKPTDGEAPNP